VVVDQRREDGVKLRLAIRGEIYKYAYTYGKRPKYVSVGWEDMIKLWVSEAGGYNAYAPLMEIYGCELVLIKELGEGVVLVS